MNAPGSATIPPGGAAARADALDALRGLAIVWMTAFHFAFDLDHFGWIAQDFYRDPFWTWQRSAIVSLFLFCAGAGQAIAHAQGQPWPRFWRRWAQVAGCALVVSAGSALMFPNSYIYFGVLHGIALMWIVMRLTAGWGRWLWLAGAVAFALKFGAQQAHALGLLGEAFNGRALNWLGLIGRKPVTEDYVPLIPWLGVMWWGMAAGQWLLRHRPALLGAGDAAAGSPHGAAAAPPSLAVAAQPAMPWLRAPLAWLGRHSLSWYMLHQPVLIGLLLAIQWLSGAMAD